MSLLTEYLWSHLDPHSADRNLRLTIRQLRQALTPREHQERSQFILSTDRGFAWNLNADYWHDADEFAALCSRRERAQ